MQGLGYIKLTSQTLPVLFRSTKYGKSLKSRLWSNNEKDFKKGYKKGIYLEDESLYLENHRDLVMDLLEGKVINL